MKIVNLEIEEGLPYTLSLTYTDETTNLPVNLTGYTAELIASKAFGSKETYLHLTTESGDITLGGSTGRIDVTISEYSSWTKASYELVLINPDLIRIKLAKGFINILSSATIPW